MPNATKRRKGFSRETFLKKYDNIHLEKDLKVVEGRISGFWDNLEEIRKHYENSIQSYKNALSSIIDDISQKDMNHPVIHSIRYRIKDPESLIVKIIQKSAQVPESPQNNPEIEKYRSITKNNYYKIITDLIGIRILIRYRHQWKDVHSLVWELYNPEGYEYINNWEDDYQYDPATKYIVEQPRAYIKQNSDRTIYEEIGKNIFDIRDSDNHYASLHYIINVGGKYCEIQVRTIFDEAWCECNHDFVYKSTVKDAKSRKTLERLSVILAQQTTASESTVTLMCDIATTSHRHKNDKELVSNDISGNELSINNQTEIFSSVKERAERLSKTDLSNNHII